MGVGRRQSKKLKRHIRFGTKIKRPPVTKESTKNCRAQAKYSFYERSVQRYTSRNDSRKSNSKEINN
jgi:hypothetical protein